MLDKITRSAPRPLAREAISISISSRANPLTAIKYIASWPHAQWINYIPHPYENRPQLLSCLGDKTHSRRSGTPQYPQPQAVPR